MMQQIADGRTDLILDYISAGHDARSRDATGVALIKWCQYYGDVSALKFLLSHGETVESLGENLGLSDAVFHGHWRLCQFAIEKGADVNRANPDNGETPLHLAFCKANRPAYTHIVRVLLAAGANPNAVTKPGAATGSFLRDCRTRAETPLHRAAAFGTADAVQLLLDAGADREARDTAGDTPLSWASWHLRPAAIVRSLCYGEWQVSSGALTRWTSDHGAGWGNPMESNLLGEPHLD